MTINNALLRTAFPRNLDKKKYQKSDQAEVPQSVFLHIHKMFVIEYFVFVTFSKKPPMNKYVDTTQKRS